MQKKVFQLLVDNTSGVLSRISGLFSRRGCAGYQGVRAGRFRLPGTGHD